MMVFGLLGLGTALAISGCGGAGDSKEPVSPAATAAGTPTGTAAGTPTGTPAGTPAVLPPSVLELCPEVDGETVQAPVAFLSFDKESYELGDAVEITLRIINCASVPLTRSFPSSQKYDFSATPLGGTEVWRWSSGMTFDEPLDVTMQPGEEFTFSETWHQVDNEGQPVEAGEYELRGESTGCDRGLQTCGPSAARVIEIVSP